MTPDTEPGCAGDRTWIAELYEREWPSLMRVAYLLTNSRPTAEEIVQDAFVRLHATRTTVLNPAAYVRTVVVNACRDVHRHQAVVARNPLPAREPAIAEHDELFDARPAAVAPASCVGASVPRRPRRTRHRRSARLSSRHCQIARPSSTRHPSEGPQRMNATLEDRLRHHYDERTRDIPKHGPGLDDAAMLRIHPGQAGPRPHRAARVSLVIGSVAAATLLGFVLVLVSRPTTERPGVGTVGPSSPNSPTTENVEALAPVQTLPAGADVSDTPVTVAASGPTDWYRLQPDLDVAWYQEPSGQSPSMLCWRTPAGSECIPDQSPGALPLIVPTAGGQTLVVTGGITDSTTLDVQLTRGAVLNAPLEIDDTISWGVARYQLPDGETITAIGNASVQASEAMDVPGRTLPPTVGLSDVPVTIVSGSELSYWRWFPDLDISERQTADGGTELCWRTPAGTGCIDDSFISPEVGIIPTDGGAILLARPALIAIIPTPSDPLAPKFEQGPPPSTITATLSDGSTVTADINYGDQFGVGHARVTLDAGLTIASATSG